MKAIRWMSGQQPREFPLSRRQALVGAAGIIVVGVAGGAEMAAATGGSASQVGASGPASGLEFLGEISQEGETLTGYGYLTEVSGLQLDQLYFGGGEPSEATARFTFHGVAHLTSMQRRNDLLVGHAEGQLHFYLRDTPGATFADPSTFAAGQRIATDDATLESINNVIAPNTGVINVFGDLRRTEIAAFRLDRRRHQLGRIGLLSRLVAPGKGLRLDPVVPRAILVVGGNTTNPTPVADEHDR